MKPIPVHSGVSVLKTSENWLVNVGKLSEVKLPLLGIFLSDILTLKVKS